MKYLEINTLRLLLGVAKTEPLSYFFTLCIAHLENRVSQNLYLLEPYGKSISNDVSK